MFKPKVIYCCPFQGGSSVVALFYLFWCQFRYVCTDYFQFGLAIAEWPPFGKDLLTRLTICSLCIRVLVMFININFSSVRVANMPPFGKELSIQLAICSPCILTICYSSHSLFWF